MATDLQKHYREFRTRFKAMTDKQLIDAFNHEAGIPGWVSARGEYLRALHDEFEKRKIIINS